MFKINNEKTKKGVFINFMFLLISHLVLVFLF